MSKRQQRRETRGIARLEKKYGGKEGLAEAILQTQAIREAERATRPQLCPYCNRVIAPADRQGRGRCKDKNDAGACLSRAAANSSTATRGGGSS
jgi:hypothetical protein